MKNSPKPKILHWV